MTDPTRGRTEGPRPRRTGHEEAWDLLPWLVNDSLEETERARVEEHVVSCAICREEVRYWGSFQALVREEGDLDVPSDPGLERLRRRIGSSPERRAGRLHGRARGVAATVRRWRETPAPVRWLVAAQLAGLLLLGGLLAGQEVGSRSPGPEAVPAPASTAFRTLSDPSSTAGVQAPLLRVVFADQAREREMRGALIAIGGRLVAGPSPTGVYTVAVDPEDDLPAVLATLRSFPQVLFAEPAAASGEVP